MNHFEYSTTIDNDQVGCRLDRYLIQQCSHFAGRAKQLSRSTAQQMVQRGSVTVNGSIQKPSYKLKAGDLVWMSVELDSTVAPPLKTLPPISRSAHNIPPDQGRGHKLDLAPESIPLNILFQDSDLVVLDKPLNLIVQPTPAVRSGTLINALIHHCGAEQRELARYGLVHRLDKDTTGVMVVAKSNPAQQHLTAQFKDHTVQRTYVTVVCGQPKNSTGIISVPLGRSRNDFRKMTVKENGRRAVTHYRVLHSLDRLAQLELKLETGRTHQIRVHLASIGHPVAGDPTYGGGNKRAFNEASTKQIRQIVNQLNRQALHALTLGFIHPRTGRFIQFFSSIPLDLAPLFGLFPSLSCNGLQPPSARESSINVDAL
ncbi:RNA pseudouridine synthase [Candidatus Poribacteria bacterium]|nr:RNA pseudouridine synthase [Candidatus Poribacteria bacterium]